MRSTVIMAAAVVAVALILLVLAILAVAGRPSHTSPDYPAGMISQLR